MIIFYFILSKFCVCLVLIYFWFLFVFMEIERKLVNIYFYALKELLDILSMLFLVISNELNDTINYSFQFHIFNWIMYVLFD